MKKEVIAHKNPKSPISEIFRTLRTNIQFMDTNKKMKTLLVTSTFPGEGKSWVTSNLAVTFAQAGKRVVLIDADMRKGRQYSIFEVSPTPGLSNYLSQTEIDENGHSSEDIRNYIQETEVSNLFVVSAGNVPPNPSELLVSAQMVTLINELRNIYDLVIIDGTPCELVTDSVILSRLVDSTIVVTAHKKTKKDALDRVIKNIQNVGGTIAGVVLNKMPITSKRYGESYYYYGSHDNKTKKNIVKKMNNVNERVDKKILKLEKEIQESKRSENVENSEEEATEVEQKNIEVENINNQENHTENNNNIEKTVEESFVDKTNEILKQINDYIEQEKKNMNN